ncbi:uncharacterized protein LOC110710754 [Chenopodium quinoa]|uniref:uncharacterized protein LOC110710754 n=1 Tax=Chenopodium quinoa TaxID=63459 RepID=UPI000B785A0F|nr:uncharacterized protein LOC110710754 [Chenopodium quinoa]
MKTLKPNFTLSPTPTLSKSSSFHSKPPQNLRKCSHYLRVYTLNPISCSSSNKVSPPSARTSSSSSTSLLVSGVGPTRFKGHSWNSEVMEENLEKVIYRCRFVTFLGVFGSLIGSVLCFIKGCGIVASSFYEYFAQSGKVIVLVIEAIDIYLLGTVMLIFGMGLYELFVSNLDIAKSLSEAKHQHQHRSSLFGLFPLMERPKWLVIKSVSELKTKVGHVIVMLLLIGLFDNSKKAAIHSPTDLLCFSASVLLCSGCLFMLSKLNGSK